MNLTYTKPRRQYRVDEVFYLMGKLIFIPFCVFGIWFSYKGFDLLGDSFFCTFKKVTGFPCPGCGGTRAFVYLFQGDIYKSIKLNFSVIYGVIAYLHFMILFFYRKHISKKTRTKEISIQFYLYGAVVVILGQWLIKVVRILLMLNA